MPSSRKTPKLGLNLYSGTDKPKMEDVNFDNTQLDQLVGAHLADLASHLTEADRIKLGALTVLQGSYTGDNAASRTIQLEETPALGLLFAQGQAMWAPNPSVSGQTLVLGGLFTSTGCTAGLTLEGRVLTVRQTAGSSVGEYAYLLNSSGTEYRYLFFKKAE